MEMENRQLRHNAQRLDGQTDGQTNVS